jgi:hypothetical protein
MDLNFPRPSLNSPAESGTAAGNAFYANVMRRAQESRERRILLNEVLSEMFRHETPDYAEIVRQINVCIAEITPRLTLTELTQMLQTTPIAEIETVLKKLEKMRPVR